MLRISHILNKSWRSKIDHCQSYFLHYFIRLIFAVNLHKVIEALSHTIDAYSLLFKVKIILGAKLII